MIKIIKDVYEPISLMGEIAAICWNTELKDDEHAFRIGLDCLRSGHHRVSEFPDVIIEISEYSARVMRELYTHIIGVTRLQESTRYVDCSDFDYYVPDSIKNSEPAFTYYKHMMDQLQGCYCALLDDCKIPKQDIANILPLGMHTKIVLKINLRALMHMAEVRMCNRALKEYRDFMQELKKTLSEISPEWDVFCREFMRPKCEVYGYCNEKQSCGKFKKGE